jgi:hypothetical protein
MRRGSQNTKLASRSTLLKQNLIDALRNKKAIIGIVGLGYVGLQWGITPKIEEALTLLRRL